MMRLSIAALLLVCAAMRAGAVSQEARSIASYAAQTYADETVASLARMVSYNTQALEGVAFAENPAMNGFKSYLKSLAAALELDFSDHGHVMLIGLGDAPRRLGVITHGDVQPADAAQWRKSPYELDTTSEPGKLIGRGTEDNKGPIATALYAMRAIKDKDVALNRRIELMVYMAEESDWAPLQAFLESWEAPEMNITIDSNYPAVTAEKGWSSIEVTVPELNGAAGEQARLTEFSGGSFASQIPLQASVRVENATARLIDAIRSRGAKHPAMTYSFAREGDTVTIFATGKAAHSATPQNGVNAVAFLADALSVQTWPRTAAALTVAYINELVGTGFLAEKFGDLAFEDEFMGPLTLSPTVVKDTENGTRIFINLRRPRGKQTALLERQAQAALADWQRRHDVKLVDISISWGDPLVVEDAPHLPTLLEVYAHFTGQKNPQPVSIGGSTNAKLFPNALSFGPSMPGVAYTGHSEHEFITRDQLMLNLKMYTAVFVELGRMQ